jgi:hypothetical protein
VAGARADLRFDHRDGGTHVEIVRVDGQLEISIEQSDETSPDG